MDLHPQGPQIEAASITAQGALLQRNARRPPVLFSVIGLALIVRVIWALIAPKVDPVLKQDPLHGDASGYHVLALNLLNGNGLSWDGTTPTSYRMPGYPAFLASAYWLSDNGPRTVRLVHAALGALLCMPVYVLTRRLADKSAALVAATGIALYPLLIYMGGWLYSETLFILVLWVAIAVMLHAMIRESPPLGALAGVFIGVATLIRPEAIMLPMAWMLMAAVGGWSRDIFKLAFAAFFVSILVLTPWFIRNFNVHGELVPLTTSSGSNFYAGNNADSRGGSAWVFPMDGVSELESDRELKRRAIQWIAGNPSEFLMLLPKKALKFFSPLAMEASGLQSRWWFMPVNIAYSAFLLLAALGASKTWKTDVGLLLLGLIALYLATALIFYGGTRVALPIAPALIVMASAQIMPVIRRVWERDSSWKPEALVGGHT